MPEKLFKKFEIDEIKYELLEDNVDDSIWVRIIQMEENEPYINEVVVWVPMGGYTVAYTRMPDSIKKEIVKYLIGSRYKFAELPELWADM